MKLATHLTLSLLLIISICAAAATEKSSSDAVVDIDGDEVKAGVEYYIGSPLSEHGSFFSLGASNDWSPCRNPLDVVLKDLESISSLDPGLPLTFVNSKPGSVVRVATDVNIKFTAGESTALWNLDHDRCLNRSVVTTGGGVKGWFKFESVYPPIYKIVSCAPAAYCGDLAYPAADFGSPLRRMLISKDDYFIWVLILKAANFTQAHKNKMMNININAIPSLATH